MTRILAPAVLLAVFVQSALGIQAPTGLVIYAGDRSIILHWDQNPESNVSTYKVYRALASGGPFTVQTPSSLTPLGFCDLNVSDGQAYYYQVTAVDTSSQESLPSVTVSVVPTAFATDGAFLDYLQQANFDYFWYSANPANGLIPDRSAAGSACSIASVGFGLTAIGIAIDHGWITRDQGVTRVLATLNTFVQGPQGPHASGEIGYNGWFYHFLDMNGATRASGSELSSIDTTLLLAGVLYAKQYFNGANSNEAGIRAMGDTIFNRVNWNWMAQGSNGVAMAWQPVTGFTNYGNWIGYDEGMILYLLGLGIATNPLPAASWSYWTNGYTWGTYYGESFVVFAPLFGHEYSHCWVDFRHVADDYMSAQGSTYFENSRRAALAQQAYCAANPLGHTAYSSVVWGLTASDDPAGYEAHGAPPALNDDGTITPSAPGGAMAFAPDIALPTLEYFYSHYRQHVWTAYGFRDAFNIGAQWYDTDELGIDQGPIVIMIENYRTQRVWNLFMQNAEIQRGLQRAGFVPVPLAPLSVQTLPVQNSVTITWPASAGNAYQVEYSTNLLNWITVPAGDLIATNAIALWTDSGPPGTASLPLTDTARFYRVLQYGSP